jgi:hypothetical protein
MAVRIGSVETEHGHECVVDGPQLSRGQSSDTAAESLNIDRAELFDQHAR